MNVKVIICDYYYYYYYHLIGFSEESHMMSQKNFHITFMITLALIFKTLRETIPPISSEIISSIFPGNIVFFSLCQSRNNNNKFAKIDVKEKERR